MVRAFAQRDQGDVGVLAAGGSGDRLHLDPGADDGVAEPGQHLGEERETLRLLIRDQDAQVFVHARGLVSLVAHRSLGHYPFARGIIARAGGHLPDCERLQVNRQPVAANPWPRRQRGRNAWLLDNGSAHGPEWSRHA